MSYDSEAKFEADLIKTLVEEKGWDGGVLEYKNEKELIQNWANIIYDNNRNIDRLGDYPITSGEMQQIMEQNKETYSRLDQDTRELLEVVAKIRIKEEEEVMENGEKKYDMCKAFVDMKLEGIEEGRQEGREEGRKEGRKEGSRERLVNTICIKLRKNKQPQIIAEELEEELSEIEKVIAAQKKVGSYDVKQICMAMLE